MDKPNVDLTDRFVRAIDRLEVPRRETPAFSHTPARSWFPGAAAVAAAVVLIALALVPVLGQRAANPAATPVPSAAPTQTPGVAAPTPLATTGAPSGTDVFCGVLSANSVTSGQGSGPDTYQLRPATSVRTGPIPWETFGGWVTGRPPLGTYVCALIGQGAPSQGAPIGVFQRAINANDAGYIASIVPKGFVLPPECRYVGLPTAVPGDHPAVAWRFDCGAAGNRDARGSLLAAFTQHGWTPCAPALATATWRKEVSRLTVIESSGAPGDFPTLTQRLFYYGGGGPPGAGSEGCL